MARLSAKCGDCADLIWFGDFDQLGQTVVCACGAATLTEAGPSGNYVEPSEEEKATMN